MADTETKPAEKKSQLFKLKQNRMHPGESRIRFWFAEIEEGTPYEELFNPVFWDVHGYKFTPYDRIWAIPDEGHYEAELLVRAVGVGGTQIVQIRKTDLAKSEAPKTLISQYRVKYAGPHHKWRVERIADDSVVQPGFPNEGAANSWLADNLKALTSVPKKAA